MELASCSAAALVALSVLDVLRGQHDSVTLDVMATSLCLAVATASEFLVVPILLQGAVGVIVLLGDRVLRRPVARASTYVVLGLCSLSAVWHAHSILVEYPDFAGYWPTNLAFLILGIVMVGGTLVLVESPDRWRALRRVFAWGAIAGGLLVMVLNGSLYKGLYPTLHASLLHVAFLLLQLGCTHLVRLRSGCPRSAAVLAAPVMIFVVLAAAGLALQQTPGETSAMPSFLSLTMFGQQKSVVTTAIDEPLLVRRAPYGPGDIERFYSLAAMPALPPELDRTRTNVLLITVESLRYDETSLAGSSVDSTPNLRRMLETGDATSYSRAYSPSTGTLLSMASVHSMTYPSSASVRFWRKHWHGDLENTDRLAAEDARAAGRHTFWYSHDHNRAFSRCLPGFARGFDDIGLVYATEAGVDTDSVIADRVIAKLGNLGPPPFFGWIFFASPHAGYVVHDRSAPGASERERYRQEVSFADAQLGRVLAALEARGLAETTIVIVTGDHGEEFGEHGGNRHKSTVYEEQSHVPLVIRIPNSRGGVETRPTSSAYVLAWAFSALEIGDTARRRIVSDFLPMMDNTDNAVVVELLGNASPRGALVFADQKLIFDFRSGRTEYFDLRQDPNEKRNIISSLRPDDPMLRAMGRYRTLHRARRNHSTDATRVCQNRE